MIKILSILALLTILALPCSSSDYLEGGNVGSYTGDAGQYFTDPIFMMKVGGGATSAPNSAYASKPVTPLGSAAGKTTLGRYSASNTPVSKTFSSTPVTTTITAATNTGVSGKWVLRLSEGQTIALDLHQSGTRLFGRGSITSAGTTKMALASGTASGNFVTLDVLPESGTELYSLSFDISKLNTPTSYTAYRYGALTGYGTVTASKVA